MAIPAITYFNPSTGERYTGDYNIYAIAEKTVYHPLTLVDRPIPRTRSRCGGSSELDTKKGLDLLFEAVGEPGDRNSLQYEFTLGAPLYGTL